MIDYRNLSYESKVLIAMAYRDMIRRGYTPSDMRRFLAKKARELEEKTGIPHIVYGAWVIPVDPQNKRYRQLLEYARRLLEKWRREGERTERGIKMDEARDARIPRFFDQWMDTKGRKYDLPGLDSKKKEKKKRTRKKTGKKGKKKKAVAVAQ